MDSQVHNAGVGDIKGKPQTTDAKPLAPDGHDVVSDQSEIKQVVDGLNDSGIAGTPSPSRDIYEDSAYSSDGSTGIYEDELGVSHQASVSYGIKGGLEDSWEMVPDWGNPEVAVQNVAEEASTSLDPLKAEGLEDATAVGLQTVTSEHDVATLENAQATQKLVQEKSPLSVKNLTHAVSSKMNITQMVLNKLLEETEGDAEKHQAVIDANIQLVENFQDLLDGLSGSNTTQFTEKQRKKC